MAEGDRSPDIVEGVLRVLHPLLDPPRGPVVKARVEALLGQEERARDERERAYCRLLRDTLARLAVTGEPGDSETYRFVAETLEPPVMTEELRRLAELLSSRGGEEASRRTGGDSPRESTPEGTEAALRPRFSSMDDPEQRGNMVYRQHLQSRTRDIEALHNQLYCEAQETIRRNREAGELLESLITHLQLASDLPEVIGADSRLTDEIRRIADAHQAVAEKLDTTFHSLQSIASDNTRLQAELQRVRTLSLTDEGTDLPNRRALLRQLKAEIGRVQRNSGFFSLVLMDLDRFKAINDRHGHNTGDDVLRVYAREVLSVFRAHDLVARYGGEEFAVLMPSTPLEGAMKAMEKIRRRVGETSVDIGGERLPLPTFSAGIAEYRAGESADELIQRADKALYRAKANGRDRTELDTTGRGPLTSGSGLLGAAADDVAQRTGDRDEAL